MNHAKYIGPDVHQATILVAVLDSAGNLVVEAILETKAETILQFVLSNMGPGRVEVNGINSRHVAEFAADEGKQDRLFYEEGGLQFPPPGFTQKTADASLRSIEGLLFALTDDLVDHLSLCVFDGLGRRQPHVVG